mgnify:CR=1 FL=1
MKEQKEFLKTEKELQWQHIKEEVEHIADGVFRIQSIGADLMELLSPEEQREKLKLYRKEMDDFTTFLKDQYFQEN